MAVGLKKNVGYWEDIVRNKEILRRIEGERTMIKNTQTENELVTI